MKTAGIFNDVIGPVMRGPSSSHTAGAFHISSLAASLLGDPFIRARFIFDPDGSYGRVFREQGADVAFAAGLLGWSITDERFEQALQAASSDAREIEFTVEPVADADHPNTVEMELFSEKGATLRLRAKSTGGGAIEITRLNTFAVKFTGRYHETAIEFTGENPGAVEELLNRDGECLEIVADAASAGSVLIAARRISPLPDEVRSDIRNLQGVEKLWTGAPLFFVEKGEPIWSNGREMIELAEASNRSLGRLALQYETTLLDAGEEVVLDEMSRRFDVMKASIERGLSDDTPSMQLLSPTAKDLFKSIDEGNLPAGGMHARAAARALAVMHVNAGKGLVCAAPTAGSAGVIPAVILTLAEERRLEHETILTSLLAAGAIGVVIAQQATFAAEVAGCQVEIGAATAMAAAAVVDAMGGSARQAADAAAIALQNSMGSVCDLVQGMVEIPCHTRNAAGASSAFICADMILGGYSNPIPLHETVDAVHEVGRALPPELRCTALGGLAVAPSARALGNRSD